MSDMNLQVVDPSKTFADNTCSTGAEDNTEWRWTTGSSQGSQNNDTGGGHGEDKQKSEALQDNGEKESKPRILYHNEVDDYPLAPEPVWNVTADDLFVDLISEDGFGFDYVMVFKAEQLGVMSEKTRDIIRQIMAAGLHVRVYLSRTKAEIFCEIRVTVERLMEFAEQVDHKMLLDEFELAEATTSGDPEANIAPIFINDDPEISSLSPYEYIYARYDTQPGLQKLYFKCKGMWHPFRAVVRLSLIVRIIETPTRLGGAGLKVEKMKHDREILAMFPKHFKKNKSRLHKNWLVFKQWPWETPYDEIKDYYGEKIGLYFHFLGYLTTWLIPLAAAGAVTALTVYASGNPEHPITLVFAPSVVLWGIGMLEFWKRKEKRIALEWGMIGFETSEHDRPEYDGVIITSPIDGQTMLYYPNQKRMWKSRRATGAIMTMILVVVSCIAGVYALRWYLVYGMRSTWGKTYGGVIASVVNSVQIHILDAVYKRVAVSLTDFENHRTATRYEDSLIAKLFGFSFCNSYGGLIYLAFIGDPVLSVPCERNCMSLLATNLAVVFVVKLMIGNLTEVLIPYVKYRLREVVNIRRIGPVVGKIPLTQAEEGYALEEYDPIMGTLMDYAELAVQFGYITLFVVAFPLAPLLALASNYIASRSDAFKVLMQLRRPVPRGAEDIGRWQYVFTIITCISVVTNSALICLIYSSLVGTLSLASRLWLFILLQWASFVLMVALGVTVPDITDDVTIQLERTAFLSKKIIDKISDDAGDIVQEVDQGAFEEIEVTVSPPCTPEKRGLSRERTVR